MPRGGSTQHTISMHDPLKFASDLSAKLATRSRHVCVFLGAGSSRACGLPDINELQKRVLEHLDQDNKTALARQLTGRNLEQALSRLRRIAALLAPGQAFDGLTAEQARALDAAVCQAIVKELNIAGKDLKAAESLAAWAARADYRSPLELFTVNYDLLIETALERRRVPYFDGFIGALRARFYTDLVEGVPEREGESIPTFFVRLWKLHGSVNWLWEDGRQVVRLGHPVTEGSVAAIYPSDTKYDESRRVPFVVLQDRFRRALHHPESLVIIAGYSFGDDHLNELIFDAASRRPRSEFLAFCYSEIPEQLAARALTTPNLQAVTGHEAIVGAARAAWRAPADAMPTLWINDKFALRDFNCLAAFLASSAPNDQQADAVGDLLKAAAKLAS
jgi:SIR2-like domain